MSTRCQIEFRSGNARRTIYRHWDGYPSAVIPDLLAFLAWSRRRGDVEYETANFLYWSKRDLGSSEQLGFGVCANDELHGDIAYYYGRALRRSRVHDQRARGRARGRKRVGRACDRARLFTPLSRLRLAARVVPRLWVGKSENLSFQQVNVPPVGGTRVFVSTSPITEEES